MTIGSFLEKKKINDFINKYDMLRKGDGVVLGLSGGPDSVCLFFALLGLQQAYELKLKAVHVNHMIRGKDADEDQAFVEKLCQDYGVECISEKIDIPAMAKASGRSVEEEARMARYALFTQVAEDFATEENRQVKIAVAHNADDNAETVLFHMARGAGLDGMCGIAPKRGNIIRPLLKVPKAEILAFLEENGLDYCVDATNADINYDRNRIRHNILPELAQVNDRALEHVSDMTEHLFEVQEFLNFEARGLLEMAKEPDGAIRKKTLQTAPKVLQTQALKLYLSKYMPDEKDVSQVHIDAVISMLDQEGEKQVSLPHKKTLIISYDKLFVTEAENEKNIVDEGAFEFKKISLIQGLEYPKETYTKWFDCDKIAEEITIRTRKEGDFLTINSAGGTKLLQDYFIDEKVPKHMRDQIPLLCDGSHVVWVVGYRISEYYKISDETVNVLEAKYLKELN